MAPRLALGHCFFSHDDVELASPLQRSDYTVKRVHDYSALLRTQRTRKGEAVLSKVVKFTSKKTRLSNMHLEARTGYIYTLRKPSVWFRRLCEDKIIRHWLQEQIEDGNVVHFVVGLHTLFDAATSSNANLAMQHSGELTMPVSDASGWSNLSHAGDFGLSGGQWYNKDSQNACKAPGEQIFAIRVKKVKFRFWDTHDVENVRLGKNSYWKMASDNRSATEDDSEIVEAFLDKAEKAESDSEDDEKSDKFPGRLSDDDSSDDELYFIDSDEE